MNENQATAFPGAVGCGALTPGGRGGKIIYVTNLNNSGPGSFKDAVEGREEGPRFIIFSVAGTIENAGSIKIRSPYISIYGQTSFLGGGQGITIRDGEIVIMTHDVVIQHLRVRMGDGPWAQKEAKTASCFMFVQKEDVSWDSEVYNVVIDHCSITWSQDTLVGFFAEQKRSAPIHHVSLTNILAAEPLDDSHHPEGPHGKGIGVGHYVDHVTLAYCLQVACNARSPLMRAYSREVLNTVTYNCVKKCETGDDDPEVPPIELNFIGNTDITGPSSRRSNMVALNPDDSSLSKGHLIYVSNNSGFHTTSDPWSVVSVGYTTSGEMAPKTYQVLSPITFDNLRVDVPILPQSEGYDFVVENAGANIFRDLVDVRVLGDMHNLTGKIIDSQDEVGGWPTLQNGIYPLDSNQNGLPDYWETKYGVSDPHGHELSPLWTNVELYAYSIVADPPIDPPVDPPVDPPIKPPVDPPIITPPPTKPPEEIEFWPVYIPAGVKRIMIFIEDKDNEPRN